MTSEVTRRLAEGIAAVDNTQLYVQACAARGYHHPDLTLHTAQIHDWYGSEDGLDLRAVDADGMTLQSVARDTADALASLRAQTVACAAVWDGEGGGAAMDFLNRHLSEAAHVVAAVDRAAATLRRLHDDLWRLVDSKVDATVSIDDRTASQRPAWSAAARGDGSPEIVDTQIRPYVESTIAGEWVPAMRAARDGVEAAYRSAVEAVSARPRVRFEIPGDLVPGVRSSAGQSLPAAGVAPSAGSFAPSVMSTPPAAGAPGAPAEPTVPQALPPESAPMGTPVPADAAPPGPLAGPGGPGTPPTGLSDALGGLFDPGALSPGGLDAWGASTPESGDPGDPDSGEPDIDETAGDEPDTDDPDIDELREKVLHAAEDVAAEDVAAEDVAVDPETDGGDIDAGSTEAGSAVAPEAPPAEAAACPEGTDEMPAPEPAPPVTEPVPDAEQTPCEIAADELPQVGE